MADSWEDEDFEPPPAVVEPPSKKGMWDDEDAEEEPKVESSKASESKPKTDKKKGKVAAPAAASLEEDEVLDDPIAEKLRQQRLVEEADFKATKELFGNTGKEVKSLDDFIPKSEADFLEYAELAAAKLTIYEKSHFYPAMLKHLMKLAIASMDANTSKDISGALTVVTNQKIKVEREGAGGKGKKGAKTKTKLNVDRAEDVDDMRGGGYDADEYDFM